MSDFEKRKPENITAIRNLPTSENEQDAEPLLTDCPYCYAFHESKLIQFCPVRVQTLADQALYTSELIVQVMGALTVEKNTMRISDATYARLMMTTKVADVEARKLFDMLNSEPPQEDCGCIPN